MTKPTITMLTVSLIYCVLFGGVLIYAYVSVSSQGQEVKRLELTMAEQNAKELAARSITEIISKTQDSRDKLSRYFVTEKDTINFITDIESLAASLGVSIETTSLEILPGQTGARGQLKTSFAVEGDRTAIKNFIKAIENLPYHSTVPELEIDLNGNEWSAYISVLVTMSS